MQAFLKRLYPQARVSKMVYENNPLLGILERQLAPGPGQAIQVVVQYGDVHNRSATYADARGSDSGVASQAFSITVAKNFNRVLVDHELILSSETDKQSFGRAMDINVSGCFNALMNDIGFQVFRSSVGTLGQLSANTASATVPVITFSSRQALRTLGVGSKLRASANADLSSPRAETIVVTKIDRETGAVTCAGDASAWGTTDYVFVLGDANSKFKGLADWIPSGAGRATALAAPFFGVDRSIDAVRLGGIEFDGTSMATSEALIKVGARLFEEGARPSVVIMSPSDYANLMLECHGRTTEGFVPGQVANIGYKGIKLIGMVADATILPDPNCPNGLCYMLDTSTWKIAHLGREIVNTWNSDSLSSIRDAANNALEVMIYSYMQLFCEAPGKNAVIRLAQ
jgi:hypothetical protein